MLRYVGRLFEHERSFTEPTDDAKRCSELVAAVGGVGKARQVRLRSIAGRFNGLVRRRRIGADLCCASICTGCHVDQHP